MPDHELDRLLRPSEAAWHFACSKRTIERMIRSGELPVVRIPAGNRVRMSDVQSLIRSRSTNPPDAPLAFGT